DLPPGAGGDRVAAAARGVRRRSDGERQRSARARHESVSVRGQPDPAAGARARRIAGRELLAFRNQGVRRLVLPLLILVSRVVFAQTLSPEVPVTSGAVAASAEQSRRPRIVRNG